MPLCHEAGIRVLYEVNFEWHFSVVHVLVGEVKKLNMLTFACLLACLQICAIDLLDLGLLSL